MTERYKVRKLRGGSLVLTYNYGKYTVIECSESSGKTILINEIDDSHLEEIFDRVFDLGEYKKFLKQLTVHTREKNVGNPHCVKHTLISTYIPKQARKDFKAEKVDKDKSDLIGKYFK